MREKSNVPDRGTKKIPHGHDMKQKAQRSKKKERETFNNPFAEAFNKKP
jgi:hypothetical protein